MRDKIFGAMFGFAVGDALGATTEFMHHEEIARELGTHTEITGGGWLDLEPGQVTDDTEMMLCVARSLVDCRGVNLIDMADNLVEWYRGEPVDVGNACRRGILAYANSGDLFVEPRVDQGGNGALMRILPMLLVNCSMQKVLDHAHLTHNNGDSDYAIKRYAFDIDMALHDERYLDIAYRDNPSGYSINTLNTVQHCFSTCNSFEESLIKCVNLGGDADTTGAILGGLAGAYYGINAIPRRWLLALDKGVAKELAVLSKQLINWGVPDGR